MKENVIINIIQRVIIICVFGVCLAGVDWASNNVVFSASAAIVIAGCLTVLACAYMAPTFHAIERNHDLKWQIACINIFLGWTFVGYFIAAALANSEIEEKA